MMRSRRSRWIRSIGAMVLTGGMLVASAGLGVTVAALFWFVNPAGAIPLESWDNKIPNANLRFKVLPEFSGQAVLDRETQLVWEQAPDATPRVWNGATYDCINKVTGGRKGWRLPSVAELASLVDPANSIPALPAGHPFSSISTSAIYWSATTHAGDPTFAWGVFFFSGSVGSVLKTNVNTLNWCVRGGMGADAY